MKLPHAFLAAGLLLLHTTVSASTNIPVRMFCLSLALDRSTTFQNGEEFDLEVTSLDSTQPANGEMAALSEDESDYSNGGLLFFYEPLILDGPIPMRFAIDVPAYVDSDNDGIHDFFEASAAVDSSSAGAYIDPTDGHQYALNAKWTRNAGSASGVCQLQLPHLGLTFKPVFHLLEYTGSFSYQRSGTNISAQVALQQTGAESNMLNGSMAFQIAGTNALNIAISQLYRAPDATVQTSASYMDLTATTHFGDIVLDLDNTVYSGVLFLSDGEPATAAPDYQAWIVVFRDTSDANTNGNPDLTDPAQTGGVTPPMLSLALDLGRLKLSIAGTPGASYDLEQSMILPAASWTKNSSVTLTNSNQIIDLGPFANVTTFYRLRAGQ
ncbi:MAG: hypothetical protein JWM99_4807 [Verrucomicrobiales bacterium]|nr:hypothetical protein [Verrucomicrobiales bacterium]